MMTNAVTQVTSMVNKILDLPEAAVPFRCAAHRLCNVQDRTPSVHWRWRRYRRRFEAGRTLSVETLFRPGDSYGSGSGKGGSGPSGAIQTRMASLSYCIECPSGEPNAGEKQGFQFYPVVGNHTQEPLREPSGFPKECGN